MTVAGEAARRPVLVVYAHIGGSAVLYRDRLRRALPNVEIAPTDLPGCGARHDEAPAKDLEAIAAAESERLGRDGPPLFLFGHSLGALVAYEVARRRQARGGAVRGLIVSGRVAPDVPRCAWSGGWSDADVLAMLRRVGSTPEAVLQDRDMMAFFMPSLRAGFRMLDSYRFVLGHRLRCPVLVLGGRDDPLVDEPGLAGWQRCVDGPMTLSRPPGGHMYPLVGDLGWTAAIDLFIEGAHAGA